MTADPFDLDVLIRPGLLKVDALGDRIDRDRWDRPYVVLPDGSRREAYTRVSTLAKANDDTYNLDRWRQRIIVIGFTRRPDLWARAEAAAEDRDVLDKIMQQAFIAGGGEERANYGTAMHSFTEHLDLGGSMDAVPVWARADCEAYLDALELYGLEPVGIEEFVVHDGLKAAGTLDRRYVVKRTGELVVGDLKTGDHDPNYPTGVVTQTAIYASSQRYDEDGTRSELGVSLEVALLMHLPLGKAECTVYDLDITQGHRAARAALWVREWRKAKPIRVREV